MEWIKILNIEWDIRREGYLYQNRYKYYPALGGTHQEDAPKIFIDKNTWPGMDKNTWPVA